VEAQAQPTETRGKHGTKRDPNRKRGQRLSMLETIDILALSKKGISASEISRAMGISVERVAERIRNHASTMDTALGVLQANAHQAAVAWVNSFEFARKRGEHRPMRDALIAVGVVAPDAQNVGVTVVVGGGDVGAMHAAHSSTSIDVNTVPAEHHNPTPSLLIPHEPI
jgi:hypothetical protein